MLYSSLTNEELLRLLIAQPHGPKALDELNRRALSLLEKDSETVLELKAEAEEYERQIFSLQKEVDMAHESWEGDLIKAQSDLSTAEEKLRQIKLLVGDC